jgi:ATP-dependent RNA helicase DDX46/PRP5
MHMIEIIEMEETIEDEVVLEVQMYVTSLPAFHAQFADQCHHQRRHRDRERDRDRDRDNYRRRDRSVDRRYDDRRDGDSYRSVRRDRSRDRRRSKDRDDRRRSRDKDYRNRRQDSRDRNGRRRDESTDSRRRSKKEEEDKEKLPARPSTNQSREVSWISVYGLLPDMATQLTLQTSKPSTPNPNAEEQKLARLAKLEAWKKKQAAEQAKKEAELEAAGGARSILSEIDKKAELSLAASPPVSPIVSGNVSPTPYAGKFDPKAIVKKAHGSTTTSDVLGAHVAAPHILKQSVMSATSRTFGNSKANDTSTADSTKNGELPHQPKLVRCTDDYEASLKARGNVSGFGLGAKISSEAEKSKAGPVFEEEESSRRKLEKLPTPPLGEVDSVRTNGATEDQADADEGDDDDVDMQGDGTEEERLAAARAAAEQRDELAHSKLEGNSAEISMVEATIPDDGDTVMVDPHRESPQADVMEEDEADPLDAFMSGLRATPAKASALNDVKSLKSRQQEPQAIFGDDDAGLTAIDADPDDMLAMANMKKKKKDIPTINHAKIKYEPFRRNFYSEPVDMADLSEAEVATLRLELDGIKVRGVDVPKPVQRWAQCGLGVQSLDVIQKLGYPAPTSIQSQAIPAITSGRDVIGVAKTGSGKTIAFLLPMFRHIKDQRPLDMLEGPIGLILSPTRELATQIHKECRPFLKALNLRAVCAYGGAPIKDQIADLKRGAEIIVCTPGRMIDVLAANSGRVTNLRRVTYVVLDEADRMFDMGFEPQVMKILGNIRPDRQTVLFSATFPRQMEALARKTLSKPVEIVVGGRSVVAPEIKQIVEVRNDDQKFVRLLELLGNMYSDEKNEDDRALIFVDRQESADSLLRDLMRKGYPCMSIHGGKDQIDRDSTIDDFKAGIVPILIATSVAARGLDVKQLKLVVNYDAPNHLEDYVHRAGRTGRAGNTGTAVTFLTDEQDRYAVDIAKALKQSGQPVPDAVQKLVEAFSEKVKSGKEKASVSGFGGKGLDRLDQERDAAKARERKTFKTGEEGDEDDKEVKETAGDDVFAKAASVIKALDAKPEPIPGVPKGIDLDGKITVHRTEKETGPQNQMDKVNAAVQNIAAKLSKAGVMRQGVPIDNKGPDAGAFHATLEINDFPRKSIPSLFSRSDDANIWTEKARWAVTNRTNVAKILESTGTSITTKGSFYAAGKDPGPNDNPKLYILVEGDTEVVVHDAMRELMRLLKEGTIAAADTESRAPGRYSVV